MIRVWFDPTTQHIQIDGLSPKPAQSLAVECDGYVLRASELTGRGIFALAPADIGDGNGQPFQTCDDAMNYLEKVFSQKFKVDGGEI